MVKEIGHQHSANCSPYHTGTFFNAGIIYKWFASFAIVQL